jgi:WD40 repeat protein
MKSNPVATSVRSVESLIPADFIEDRVWEFVSSDEPDESYVHPVDGLPVTSFENRVIGVAVELASGRPVWSSFGNVAVIDWEQKDLPMTSEPPPKYWAFISYSHRDRRWAEWLHKRMETYRVPRQIVGGGVPARAFPVFRDRDELSSASDLTGQVVAALADSRSLVVICSPDAANSRWVNEEIRQFQKLERADRIFAFIVGGEPQAGDCFPPALTEQRAEPIAADGRDVGDGRKNAFLKVMAGILSVEFDKLRRRDYERQLRRRTAWTSVLLILAAVLGGLTLYANRQRIVALERQKVAVSRQLATEALSQNRTRLDRSLLLAIEACRVAPTAEARSSLVQLLQSSPGLVTFLHGHSGSVTAIAISPDGKTIASGGADATLRLWSIDGRSLSEKPIYRHKTLGSDDEVRVIAFSPDGKLVASGTMGGTLRFADVATQKERFVESEFGGTISALAFTPDGKQVVVSDVSLSVLDPEADKLIEPRFSKLTMPDAAALSPDGTLVAASLHKALVFYDYQTRAPIGDPVPQDDRADILAFSRDGALLARTDRNGNIRIWSVKVREWVGPPIRRDGIVLAVAFTPENKQLSTIWSDGSLRAYDIPALTPNGEPMSFGDITSAAFGPDTRTIVTGHRDGTIRVYKVDAALHPLGIGVHTNEWLNDVAFSPDGKTLAVADDYGVTLRDLALRTEKRSNGIYGAGSIAFTADGQTLATAGREGVKFWNLVTDEVTSVPSKEKEPYNWRIALTPDGSLAAFSGHSLTLWDLRKRKVVGTPATGTGSVYGIALDPGGKLLAASSEDKSIYFFELPSGKPSGKPIAFGETAWSLAFSLDGKSVVAGGDDGKMIVFDAATHEQVGNPLPEHPSRIARIAFSPDGGLMASGGSGRSLMILDWPRRQQLGGPLFRESQYEVISGVAFSPDGKLLAASERRQMLWILDGGVEQWILRACRLANRNLTHEEWARYRPEEPYRETCH